MRIRITPKNSAILLIDMQDYFLEKLAQRKKFVKRQIEMIEEAKELGIPILSLFLSSCGEIIPEVHKRLRKYDEHQIFSKPFLSGFSNPNLEKALLELGVENILPSGIYASGCVLKTAEDANKKKCLTGRPYRIMISYDLVENNKNHPEKNKSRQRYDSVCRETAEYYKMLSLFSKD